MAWGFFKKVKAGVKKAGKFLGNLLGVASKVAPVVSQAASKIAPLTGKFAPIVEGGARLIDTAGKFAGNLSDKLTGIPPPIPRPMNDVLPLPKDKLWPDR